MRRMLLFIFLIMLSTEEGNAQNKLTIIIDSMPAKPGANFFLAGNFNSWNPGDKSSEFQYENNQWVLIKNIPSGHYEFKITRGDWKTVEEHKDYSPMNNRTLELSGDSTIHLVVGAWADDRPGGNKLETHTASPQVHILDTAFNMPQLGRRRRIWIYLPKDYATTKKKYPVLYMQDGQNVFDAATSYSGEWGVDEYLDTIKNQCEESIVVAIDNGLNKRMNEYNPWDFQNFGKGEGEEYVDFLVQTLKPHIDAHFRTLKSKKNTSIAGSSMGGLISLFAALKYPKVFGSVGVFSPAFWTASGIDSTVLADAKKLKARLFFYAGGKEGGTMIPDMKRIEKEIKKESKSTSKQVIDKSAKHNEAAWREHFPEFYQWVFCKH